MREIKFRYVYSNGKEIKTFIYTIEEIEGIAYTQFFKELKEGFKLLSRNMYTGLRDKNGIEIYEGDIVKDPYYIDETNGFLLLEILFNNGEVFGRVLNRDGFNLLKATMYKEVIGNIYENKELLEV